jgi:putative peptidoglycan lipid II flippase
MESPMMKPVRLWPAEAAKRLWTRLCLNRSSSAVILCLTLATSAIFKLSAFARESFIAAKFGISAVTDAYFGLQQFPTTLGTFMFGAFALAFTPAYAAARRRAGGVEWLPGLLFFGSMVGAALTALTLLGAPFLLHTLHIAGTRDVWSTLAILSFCFAPIIWIGIWTGICTAHGRNLRAMIVGGLPYLIMALTLFGLYAVGWLNNLSLPISLTTGFGLMGIWSVVCVLRSQPLPRHAGSLVLAWRVAEFRSFLRQLVASSIENGGFAGNQLLMLYFLAQAGTGILSANNFAMRIGMLGFSLLAQPLAQLMLARLCSAEEKERPRLFRRWILAILVMVLLCALAILVLRVPVIRVVYMRGKFQAAELNTVASLLRAWIGYFVVMSVNAGVARYLFLRHQGRLYVRRQLSAYMAANLLRLVIMGATDAPWIIWCSVATEASALLLNLHTCVAGATPREIAPALTTSSEAL